MTSESQWFDATGGFAGTVERESERERERHLSTLSVRTPGEKQEASQPLLEAPCGTETEANPKAGPTRTRWC